MKRKKIITTVLYNFYYSYENIVILMNIMKEFLCLY